MVSLKNDFQNLLQRMDNLFSVNEKERFEIALNGIVMMALPPQPPLPPQPSQQLHPANVVPNLNDAIHMYYKVVDEPIPHYEFTDEQMNAFETIRQFIQTNFAWFQTNADDATNVIEHFSTGFCG